MERHPILSQVPSAEPHIHLTPKPFQKSRHFGSFLICCALFVAGFALTMLWRNADENFFDREKMKKQLPSKKASSRPLSLKHPPNRKEFPFPMERHRLLHMIYPISERG